MRKLCLLVTLAWTGCDDKNEPVDDSGTTGTTGTTPTTGTPVDGEARVERDCAPDDGTAFTFIIGLDSASCDSDPSGPYLRIGVWYNLDPMAGGSWDLDPSKGVAGAWYSPTGDSSVTESAVSGRIEISTWDEINGATGSYALLTSGGSTLVGSFSALACLEDGPLCG